MGQGEKSLLLLYLALKNTAMLEEGVKRLRANGLNTHMSVGGIPTERVGVRVARRRDTPTERVVARSWGTPTAAEERGTLTAAAVVVEEEGTPTAAAVVEEEEGTPTAVPRASLPTVLEVRQLVLSYPLFLLGTRQQRGNC